MKVKSTILKLSLWSVIGLVPTYLVGCDKEDKDENKEENQSNDGSSQVTTGIGSNTATTSQRNSFFPSLEPINAGLLGKADGSGLVDTDEKCAHLEGDSLGAFGLALGGACHTSGFAAEIMLGEPNASTKIPGDVDGDGKANCNDLDEEKSGILMHLMCNPMLGQFSKITSLAFGDDAEDSVVAITFADIANDNLTAAGSWTQGNQASFPANIGISMGAGFDSVKNIAAMALNDLDNGKLYINMDKEDTEGDYGMSGVVDFSTKSSASLCSTAPNKANCHWQDISLYFGEVTNDGPPNGFHLKMFADDKVNPTFMALEGKYHYPNSRTIFDDVVPGTEEIYFQFVQTAEEMWIKLIFKDANGDKITNSWLPVFEAGVCQNLGESEEKESCSSITVADYDGLWEGDASFAKVTSNLFETLEFPAMPSTNGICTTEGCLDF